MFASNFGEKIVLKPNLFDNDSLIDVYPTYHSLSSRVAEEDLFEYDLRNLSPVDFYVKYNKDRVKDIDEVKKTDPMLFGAAQYDIVRLNFTPETAFENDLLFMRKKK